MMSLWTESFGTLEESSEKQFATTLAEQVEANMRRLRLGGNDPSMIIDAVWWRVLKQFAQSNSDVPLTFYYEALDLVIEYHAYGPAILRLLGQRVGKYAQLRQKGVILPQDVEFGYVMGWPASSCG